MAEGCRDEDWQDRPVWWMAWLLKRPVPMSSILKYALLVASFCLTGAIYRVAPSFGLGLAYNVIGVAWVWANIKLVDGWNRRGWTVIALGAFSNALVLVANGGRMPTRNITMNTGKLWIPLDSNTRLLPLCDVLPGGFSIGDLLLLIGVVICVLHVLSTVLRMLRTQKTR